MLGIKKAIAGAALLGTVAIGAAACGPISGYDVEITHPPVIAVIERHVPYVNLLQVSFRIKTTATPKAFMIHMVLYKWSTLRLRWLDYGTKNWYESQLPPVGTATTWKMDTICRSGRYYSSYFIHGESSTGVKQATVLYYPYPKDKNAKSKPSFSETWKITTCNPMSK
jgi:hypothetical protein